MAIVEGGTQMTGGEEREEEILEAMRNGICIQCWGLQDPSISITND